MSQEKYQKLDDANSTEGPAFLVAIPCVSTDENIDQALRSYLRVPPAQLSQIQFVILVEGEQAETSKAAHKINEFLRTNPQVNLRVEYKDSDLGRDIAQIRRNLLNMLSQEATTPGAEQTLVVSHDADVRQIQEGFFEAVRGHFEDLNIRIAAGFVDYPVEAFAQNHYLLAMQIITDVLEEKWREKVGIIARGANAVFRLETIRELNFYKAFDPSSRQKFAHQKEPFDITSDDERMGVILSANALMEGYPGTTDVDASKVTSETFTARLEEGLNALYQSLLRSEDTDLQGLLIEVMEECGVHACIQEQRVHVRNMERLRQNILAQWSRF